jgi:hypothetical protein
MVVYTPITTAHIVSVQQIQCNLSTSAKYSEFQCNVANVILFIYLFTIFSGSAAQRELWTPRSQGFLITHNDAPQSAGLNWTSDQLVAETST